MKLARASLLVAPFMMLTDVPSASAQTEEPWAFASFEAFRYESLINLHSSVGPACCVPNVVSNPGEVLIHISAAIDVPWMSNCSAKPVTG